MINRYTDIYCCFSQAPRLTVIIGAKCSDGIVLVADRKFTTKFDESVRYDTKLFGDLSHVIMGYTGIENVFDIFRKCIVGDVIINRDSMDNNYTFTSLIPRMAQLVKEINQNLTQPNAYASFQLLVAKHAFENSVLYYINSDGETKRVQNYMSIGSGQDVADDYCSHLKHNEIRMTEFTKHAYLAIERMNYIPRLRVGIEKGKAPTIRYLEDISENDREPSQEEIEECQIYVENNMKDFKDAFFKGIKD